MRDSLLSAAPEEPNWKKGMLNVSISWEPEALLNRSLVPILQWRRLLSLRTGPLSPKRISSEAASSIIQSPTSLARRETQIELKAKFKNARYKRKLCKIKIILLWEMSLCHSLKTRACSRVTILPSFRHEGSRKCPLVSLVTPPSRLLQMPRRFKIQTFYRLTPFNRCNNSELVRASKNE